MSEFYVTVKVRNGIIYKKIMDAGYKNVNQFCSLNALNPSEVGRLLNFKMQPMGTGFQWREVVLKIADALGEIPDDLFTQEQLSLVLPKNWAERYADHYELLQLAQQPDVEQLRYIKEASKLFDSEILTDRERLILRKRFQDDKSRDEIGQELDISPSRVMQIEERALRRLRHPKSGAKEFYALVEAA